MFSKVNQSVIIFVTLASDFSTYTICILWSLHISAYYGILCKHLSKYYS